MVIIVAVARRTAMNVFNTHLLLAICLLRPISRLLCCPLDIRRRRLLPQGYGIQLRLPTCCGYLHDD